MVAVDEVLRLVLATGQGRRFSSDKRLARLADGMTPLVISVARVREALAEVQVVVRAGETPVSLDPSAQQQLVHSLDASSSMGHGLAVGVAAARNSPVRATAVLLGDIPWIAADTLERLAAVATSGAIVFPLYDGQRGHPVLFGRVFWDAFAQLDGDQDVRRVLLAHRLAWRKVPCDDPGVLRDVDTPAALGWPFSRSQDHELRTRRDLFDPAEQPLELGVVAQVAVADDLQLAARHQGIASLEKHASGEEIADHLLLMERRVAQDQVQRARRLAGQVIVGAECCRLLA